MQFAVMSLLVDNIFYPLCGYQDESVKGCLCYVSLWTPMTNVMLHYPRSAGDRHFKCDSILNKSGQPDSPQFIGNPINANNLLNPIISCTLC